MKLDGTLFPWFRRHKFPSLDFAQKWHADTRQIQWMVLTSWAQIHLVKWFFSWISAFKLDFRKHVDPWCQHTPKVLACDGTYIGVSARNLNLTKPATGVDDIDHTSITKHKQYDQVFVVDKDARLHLNYLCRKIINKLKPNENLEEREEIQHTQKNLWNSYKYWWWHPDSHS